MNIREIAALAGVSVSTVSKIMNQKDQSISAETRERVLQVAREYHYVPRAAGSRPAGSKSWTVGLVVRDLAACDRLIQGVAQAARAAGYALSLAESGGSEEEEKRALNVFCHQNADGILWEAAGPDSLALASYPAQWEIPCLPFGDQITGVPQVDYEELGYGAGQALIERRHRRIACLLPDRPWAEAFRAGCKRSMFEGQLPLDETLVFQDLDACLAELAGRRSATALICPDPAAAQEAYGRLTGLHIRIPWDLSLVTLREEEVQPVFPHLSALRVPDRSFGAWLCRRLIAEMEKGEPEGPFLWPAQIDGEQTIAAPLNETRRQIVVVGSIHMDHYLNFEALPHSGKTVSTDRSATYPGGKGTNQAVGAARLGHRVSLVGSVGDDLDAVSIYQALAEHGVSAEGVQRCPGRETGKAYIFVDPEGESMISILSGANRQLTPQRLREQAHLFARTGYCLIQTEIPMDAVYEACRLARESGAKTILKPSACRELPPALLELVDILVPNSDELREICPQEDSLPNRARRLLEQGAGTVIVTLGGEGCYTLTRQEERFYPAEDFQAVDNTGAGDAFISALAAYLMYGYSLDKAVQIATCAAGFSVTREGTIPSLINKTSLEAYLKQKAPQLLEL